MWKKILLILAALALLIGAIVFLFTDPFGKNSRAGLQIEYQNGSASVFLDENYLGKAPLLEEKIKSGEYILKITPDDKKLSNLNLPIYLEKNTLTIVVFNPGDSPKNSSSTVFELRKREDKKSAVSFETYPENAFISFDEKEVNFSPLTIEDVKPGEHRFSVSLPSYEAQDHNFFILDGYETKVTINLAKNIRLPEETQDEVNEATASVIQNKINENEIIASESANIAGPKVEIQKTGFFVAEEEVLKVRDASNSAAKELGFAKVGHFYPFLGEKSIDQKWLKIQFNQQAAWISSDFAKIIVE